MLKRASIGLGMLLLIAAGCATSGTTLTNGTLALDLGTDEGGAALIRRASWHGSPDSVVSGRPVDEGLAAWLPRGLLGETHTDNAAGRWRIDSDDVFDVARLSQSLPGDLTAEWVVELAKQGSLFRAHVELVSESRQARPVEWFPCWTASWEIPGDVHAIRAWEGLSFRRIERTLDAGRSVKLGSRLHSSDTRPVRGQNPYWLVMGDRVWFYFSLDWCGGWDAEITGRDHGFDFAVKLPPEETQLDLAPGERMAGPVLTVTVIQANDQAAARADWMVQRTALGKQLYGGPGPLYPWTYNNWYTTRFDLDGAFLKRQVAAMGPYAFDYFVIDAGWYQQVGQWEPRTDRFKPGEFEAILKSIKDQGAKVGIWTCPQFVHASKDDLPAEVDRPGFYEKFIGGYLLDLAGCDYRRRLLDHVAMLRRRYLADWWKYDQILFAPQTRAGIMRNVRAFQQALVAVRKAHPDLVIENCQSGGRMINELTMLATESQWLRDGGEHGAEHARSNVSVALQAMEFVPPWAANRWTNNFQKMDPSDDELTRFYCRSAMAGTWGLVSDLGKIPPRQRDVILKETRHYRWLNGLKGCYLYDLKRPVGGTDVAAVTFYGAKRIRAAVLAYRWERTGAFEQKFDLGRIETSRRYTVEDVDTGWKDERSGMDLCRNGLTVVFGAKRLSALVLVYAAGD